MLCDQSSRSAAVAVTARRLASSTLRCGLCIGVFLSVFGGVSRMGEGRDGVAVRWCGGGCHGGDDGVDDVFGEPLVEWGVTVQQSVVDGAVQQVEGDL